MNHTELQNEIIQKYRIDLCDGTKCENDWMRTHAHIRERRVCKWERKSSVKSTFTLLHEVGHIETTTAKMRRCEEEFFATQWAIDRMKEYGMADKIPETIKRLYQNYIFSELERGKRRGGNGYPTREQLTLKW